MAIDEEKLKALMSEEVLHSDENKSLEKVLTGGKKVTAAKDVARMFVGWIWVVFLGFGASMYSAKRQMEKHKKAKQRQSIKNI